MLSVASDIPPPDLIRKSFRWELVVAGACLLFFWADATTLYYTRGGPPGERYRRLACDMPLFVFGLGLLISVLRNRRSSWPSKWCAAALFIVFVFSEAFPFTVRMIVSAIGWDLSY